MYFIIKNHWLKPTIYVLIIIGAISTGQSEVIFLKTMGRMISDVYVNLFKCISLPIITVSIIVTLSQYKAEGAMRCVWKKTMFYTFMTTGIAAFVSACLYLLIHPSMTSTMIPSNAPISQDTLGYWQYVTAIIPNSFVAPFVENKVMSALLISIAAGLAIRHIPETELQECMTQFLRALHGLLMVMTRWIIKSLPIALFGFVTTTVSQLKSGLNIESIGTYLLIIVLANLIQGFIILPGWLKSHGIAPFKTMRQMLPALSVAFFSKSSVGTLPVTMKTIEQNLHVKPEISRFVLPLCTSINMNGCAAFIFVTVMYLMQHHGINLSIPMMGVWVIIATIAAIGNAGVPMGCFFLSASLLASMNIPITLMGVILPFYSLIDMLETALNVWSDACVTKIVDQKLALHQALEI